MKEMLVFLIMLLSGASYSQVAINTDGSQPHSRALLDVKSATKWILIPRMTKLQREQLAVLQQARASFRSFAPPNT